MGKNIDDMAAVACSAEIAGMIAPHMPEMRFPAFWEAADPIASLRRDGASTRVLLTYSGFRPNDEIIASLPALGLIQLFGAGYDGFDPAALKDRGVLLANMGGLNAGFVADHAVALALAVNQRVLDIDAWVRSGRWSEGRFPMVRSFSDRRAGIVGLGNIGQGVARRLAGFGMALSWWGPREKPGEELPRAESLLALARDCSLLIVACPGGPETEKLISADIIDAVGPDGIIVSVARGSVTDEDALIAALQSGRLGGAGLDVFVQEPTPPARWANVPNVVLSPHHGSAVHEIGTLIPQSVAQNVRRFLAGEKIANLIEA